MPAATEEGRDGVHAVAAVLGAEAGLDDAGPLLDEDADFHAFEGTGVVDEAFRVLHGGPGLLKDTEREDANADAAAALQLERADVVLKKLELAGGFALVELHAGQRGLGPVADQFGTETKDAFGGGGEAELPGVGHDAGVEGLGRRGVDRETGVEKEAGEEFRRGGRAGVDEVMHGETGIGQVVVEAGEGPRVERLHLLARAPMVGAVGKDGEAVVADLIAAEKRGVAEEEFDAARHRIGIHADGVDALRPQDAAEGDLGTDAVAIGPLVPDDHDPLAGELPEEVGKPGRETGVLFHAGPFPPRSISSSSCSIRRARSLEASRWKVRSGTWRMTTFFATMLRISPSLPRSHWPACAAAAASPRTE